MVVQTPTPLGRWPIIAVLEAISADLLLKLKLLLKRDWGGFTPAAL